jgi:two-component system, NarL family, response regulator NreC
MEAKSRSSLPLFGWSTCSFAPAKHLFAGGDMPTQAPHFFVVEDQTILRKLLISHLRAEYLGCDVTEATSLAELQKTDLSELRPDLTLVDLELPDGNSLEWVEQQLKTAHYPKMIVLTSVDEDYVLFRALHSSLPGFVHKNDEPAVLHQAIRTVLAGGVFFSATVQKMRSRMHSDPNFFNKVLSDREQKILEYLGQGLSNEEVAQLFGLRVSSVADHRKNIMCKLGLHSQTELMRYALEKGFSRI